MCPAARVALLFFYVHYVLYVHARRCIAMQRRTEHGRQCPWWQRSLRLDRRPDGRLSQRPHERSRPIIRAARGCPGRSQSRGPRSPTNRGTAASIAGPSGNVQTENEVTCHQHDPSYACTTRLFLRRIRICVTQLAAAQQQIADLQRVAQQSHERFTELELNARLSLDSQQQLQQQMGPQQIARTRVRVTTGRSACNGGMSDCSQWLALCPLIPLDTTPT
jgi:hypothetical protein